MGLTLSEKYEQGCERVDNRLLSLNTVTARVGISLVTSSGRCHCKHCILESFPILAVSELALDCRTGGCAGTRLSQQIAGTFLRVGPPCSRYTTTERRDVRCRAFLKGAFDHVVHVGQLRRARFLSSARTREKSERIYFNPPQAI